MNITTRAEDIDLFPTIVAERQAERERRAENKLAIKRYRRRRAAIELAKFCIAMIAVAAFGMATGWLASRLS